MKCIFLDLDGVLNNWYHPDGVAEENARVLKKIIDQSQAKVIVTSSNKYSIQRGDVDYYESHFFENYIKELKNYKIEIDDLTPYVDANRSLEIKQFLREHEIEQFVILDDELIEGEDLQEHQVFLDLYRGLQEEHIIPSLRILQGTLGFYPPNYDRNESPEEWNDRINAYYQEKDKNLEAYGKVVCAALLHDNCMYLSRLGHYAIFPMEPMGVLRNAKQGFVTENGYFVDRKLGLLIARHYNQIEKKHAPEEDLMSEDLKKADNKVLKYRKEYQYKKDYS